MTLAALLWICAAGLRAGTTGEHAAPAPSLAEAPRAVDSERQNTLAELWQRRIMPPEASQWSPEDMALLLRIRNAEAAGALGLLRRRFGSLKPFTVISKAPGASASKVRLTKEGYDKYLFIKTQEALKFFETKEVDAKWAFALTDTEGRKLFENGFLTQTGDALYSRALMGLPTFWKTPAGETRGNRPPPRR